MISKPTLDWQWKMVTVGDFIPDLQNIVTKVKYRMQQWIEANRDRSNEYHREYYKKNKELINSKRREKKILKISGKAGRPRDKTNYESRTK